MPILTKPNLTAFFTLTIIILLINQISCQSRCPFPFQRCICTSSTPYCPCNSLTSTQTLNLTSSYFSHLILVSSYGCRPCPPKCRKCSSLEICTDCFDEYQLLNNYCQLCPINCKKCKLGVCQQCIDEYYIDYQQKCQKCPLPGTKTCTIDSLRSCQANYWLDNNGAECVNCDPNCKICSSTTKCTKCNDGFYENNFQCSPCKSECKTCSTNSTCIDCKMDGYFFNSTLGSCTPCPSANCLSCLNNGTCILCSSDTGYYLDKSSRTCLSINSTKLSSIKNCRNITYTSPAADYACELCKDGYYMLGNDYTNASQIVCYYGCSILCAKCTGPHYGLCDSCVSDSDYNLLNRHCVPKLNLNDGTAFQLFYTAFSNSSFFQAPRLILPDSCWHQYVKGGGSTVIVRLSKLGVYKMKLRWKVYKYAFTNNNTISLNQTYGIQLNNSLVQKSSNQTLGYSIIPFVCQERTGFSSMCANGSLKQCVDKSEITFQSIITADQNTIKFTSPNSLIAISQLLIIGYRCGGIYGDGCIQCTDINTCTKCDNPNYYILQEKCTSECPKSQYTYEELKKCVEICPVGSYPEDSLHQCFSCKSPCETCNSLTECLTCREGFFYSQITQSCQTTCPQTYYKDSYRKICQKCTNPCLQCIDSMTCISCREGFLRVDQNLTALYQNISSNLTLGECVLQCPDGYYTDLTSMRCQKCASPCLTCSMMMGTCLSCVNGYYLYESQCLVQCPEGYYSDSNTSKCLQCLSSCQQCLNLTYCTQCQMGFYLAPNNTCISSCPQGYFQQQILKQCQSCSQNCSTCKSKSICSTCVMGFSYLQENYSCIKTCPQFYYSTIVQSSQNLSVCSRCQLPCYDCTNDTYCLSCYNAFLYDGDCLLACPSGYYANLTSLSCLKCDSTQCLQCKNSPTQCTKCSGSLLLVNEKCLTACPFGFYFSDYKEQCVLCEGLCSSCLNSTFCLTCTTGFVLQNSTGQCLSECQPGFYQVKNLISGSFQCFLCDQNCQICTYNSTLNKSQCITCTQNYFLTQDNTCKSTCPDGYYSLFGKCEKCSSPCSLCTDQEYCLGCLIGYGYVYEGACVSQCPYGYFQQSGACAKCDSSCLMCEGKATQCTVCQSGLFLLAQFTTNATNLSASQQTSSCQTSCPAGYTQQNLSSTANYEHICYKCSPNCFTCGSQQDMCTSCPLSWFLFQNTCIKICPIVYYPDSTKRICTPCGSLCEYCLNQTFCLECTQNYTITQNNTCVATCSSGEYNQDGLCRKCIYPCRTCRDEQNCLTCQVGIFYDGQCIDDCPEGTYLSQSQNLSFCYQCPINCSRCLSSTNCLFCSVGYLFNSTCLGKCPDGYFPNYGACQKCQENCIQCENSYACTRCVSWVFLFQQKCIGYCPTGYYQTSYVDAYGEVEGRCMPCDVKCSKCFNSSTQCMQCSVGYYLYITSCLQTCPSGTYVQPKFSLCEPCISPCQTCSNAYSCQTCIYGYLLYRQLSRNQCVQGPTCPNNYYLNIEESICEFECPVQYYVANSTRTCSRKCPQGLVTYEANRSCLEYCPQQGMWVDSSLYCQSPETRPSNLPYLKCQVLLVRNLLFLQCQTNQIIINLSDIKIGDFAVNEGEVTSVKVKNDSMFYLLVQNIARPLKSQYVTLELVSKYGLLSWSSKGSQVNVSRAEITNSNQRLLQSSNFINYPIQNYIIPVFVEEYIPFTIEQREVGMNFYEIGQSISFAALVLWFFSLVKNLKSTSLLFIINLQWLYTLSFLSANDTFPPNFNQFLESFKFSALIDIIPDLISLQKEETSWIWGLKQVQKDQFWAIYDFYDTTDSLTLVYILCGVFLFVYLLVSGIQKLSEWLSKRAEEKQKEQQAKRKQTEEQIVNENQRSSKQRSKRISSQRSIKSSQSKKSAKQQAEEPNKNPAEQQSQSLSTKSEQKPLSEIYLKMSKKSEIIKQRFHFNYLYQLIFLTGNAISLCTNIQLIKPSIEGLAQSMLIIALYLCFLSVSFYIYYQSLENHPDYKSRKPLRSTAFFFINFIQILVQNAVIIWTSFYFYVGFGFVCIVVNIIAWNWIYRKSQPQKCSYLQFIEIARGFVLVVLVVGGMKREKWSSDEIFLFGFAQIAIVFLLILLSSLSIAQQLFSDQNSLKKSMKNSSAKYELHKKLIQKPDDQDQLSDHEETSGFEDDMELDQEKSFFTNKTPVEESDEDASQGDLIDFDESVQSMSKVFDSETKNRQNFRNPPKNLFRYNKNTTDLQ